MTAREMQTQILRHVWPFSRYRVVIGSVTVLLEKDLGVEVLAVSFLSRWQIADIVPMARTSNFSLPMGSRFPSTALEISNSIRHDIGFPYRSVSHLAGSGQNITHSTVATPRQLKVLAC